MQITDTRPVQFLRTTYPNLEDQVGKTPLIPLRNVTAHLPRAVTVLAKAEWFNPSGSVKDRPALNILRDGLSRGELQKGRRLLDSTSGNMGIAYATFCASLGIPLTLCVPASASRERLTVLKALGAEVVLTDGAEGSDGAIRKARELAAGDPQRYWYANQYDNPANWRAHFESTGPELVEQTHRSITHLIAGLGTSGTLIGTGRYLRESVPAARIIGVQPESAFHGLEGLKHMPTAIKPAIYDPEFADAIVDISTETAHEMVRQLARQEGMLVGISSGAAAAAALDVARDLRAGTLVVIFPDAGHKYLSDGALWEGE